MKRKLLLSAICSVLSAAPGLCADACKKSTLNGSYAGTVSGFSVKGLPVAYQAIAHFDGAGNFSLSGFTEVQAGVVLVANASAPGGTYTVNPDCSGVMQIATPAGLFRFNILITGPGFEQFQCLRPTVVQLSAVMPFVKGDSKSETDIYSALRFTVRRGSR